MLSRYQIVRGKSAAELPQGLREDTRKHTRHVLRPPADSVTRLLNNPSAANFARFRKEYRALLEERFVEERARFDALAEAARHADVYIGCNCPTQRQPDVARCHTWLALEFMREHYPWLEVVFPMG